jgi:riboflavin synthase
MFTGLITDVATVKRTKLADGNLTVTFEKPENWQDLKLGESISTDGVCLTVSAFHANEYDSILIPETLQKSVFGIKVPTKVNLERSMQLNDRFGGHIVQGHVDTVGKVLKISKTKEWRIDIEFTAIFESLVIPKGSIAINGVSLTVADLVSNVLSVAIIPHTLEHTTLGLLKEDDKVNLEFDVIGKYIVHRMEVRGEDA